MKTLVCVFHYLLLIYETGWSLERNEKLQIVPAHLSTFLTVSSSSRLLAYILVWTVSSHSPAPSWIVNQNQNCIFLKCRSNQYYEYVFNRYLALALDHPISVDRMLKSSSFSKAIVPSEETSCKALFGSMLVMSVLFGRKNP